MLFIIMVMLQVYTPILPACVPSNCIWHWFHNLQNVCLQKWQSKKKKSPFSSSLYAFKFSLKRNTERGRLHLKNLVFYFFVRCCCCFLFFFILMLDSHLSKAQIVAQKWCLLLVYPVLTGNHSHLWYCLDLRLLLFFMSANVLLALQVNT